MPQDVVSELTGGSSAAPEGSAGAPGRGLLAGAQSSQAPPVPQTDPTRQAPAQAQQAQQAPAQAAPLNAEPKRINLDMAPEGIIEAFSQENGRRPTPSELAAFRSASLLSQQLGRRPSRRELFQHVYGRAENPQPQPPPFTLAT